MNTLEILEHQFEKSSKLSDAIFLVIASEGDGLVRDELITRFEILEKQNKMLELLTSR